VKAIRTRVLLCKYLNSFGKQRPKVTGQPIHLGNPGFKSAGIIDLSGLAQALKAVPAIERHNTALAPAVRKGKRASASSARAPIAAPIGRKEAAEIMAAIGTSQLGPLDDRKAA
jgi:hypothetical protein